MEARTKNYVDALVIPLGADAGTFTSEWFDDFRTFSYGEALVQTIDSTGLTSLVAEVVIDENLPTVEIDVSTAGLTNIPMAPKVRLKGVVSAAHSEDRTVNLMLKEMAPAEAMRYNVAAELSATVTESQVKDLTRASVGEAFIITDTTTAGDVTLQSSLDGENWYDVSTTTTTSGMDIAEISDNLGAYFKVVGDGIFVGSVFVILRTTA